MTSIFIPAELKKFAQFFLRNNFQVFWVGGAVRDIFLGKIPDDWDAATDAKPEQVIKLFNRVIPTGIEHGTVTVIFMNRHIEVTTFRTESDYSDGRHPDTVEYAGTIEEDLSRRDFTMNAIAVSLQTGAVIDPFGGKKDIKAKIIRTVGSAVERFSEDGLRPVRAIRFSAQLGFKIEEATLAAIPQAQPVIQKIAVERFREEFIKMLEAPKPSVALFLMEQTGILQIFIPELAACRGIEQKGFHQFDVLDHLFYSCDGVETQNEGSMPKGAVSQKVIVRLAALFHDIGKPEARNGSSETGFTFYNHDAISVKETALIMERLRFSKQVIEEVLHLIQHHMFHYEAHWTDAAVRRFLARIEIEPEAHSVKDSRVLKNLFDLRRADLYGMNRKPAPPEHLLEFTDRLNEILASNCAFTLKNLAVNGKDIMQLGIPGGKAIGNILNELLETVLDDPGMNTKEDLLRIAQALSSAYQRSPTTPRAQ